jgi:DNA-binding transcriptional MerR regulator
MMAKPETQTSGYRIGAVSRLTGISPDTLRIWERRYDVVTPERSAGGGRLYSSEDIARLKLIGRLVRKGDTIGVVASLSHDELEERLAETRDVSQKLAAETPYRLMVIGELLSVKMKAAADTLSSMSLVACYDTAQAFMSDADPMDADILLIEQPTLQVETAVQIVDWASRINAAHAVVVYRFSSEQAMQKLPKSRVSSLRGPVDVQAVQNHCRAILGQYRNAEQEEAEHASNQGQSVSPRQYSDEALARLASISSTIKCECPRHLAELITSLSAFEKYSSECESRNLKDSELHAYLSTTSSKARHLFELALSQVIEAENIEL